MHRKNSDSSCEEDECKMSLSLSGCGFLGIYHVGVAAAVKQYAPDLLLHSVTGSSAGALVACALMCDCCLGQATTDTLKLVIQARSKALGPLHPSFSLVRQLRDAFDNMLPYNAHEICTGRLFVSMTRFADGKNVVASEFESKNDLIDALICSAFIPFYCGTVPPTFRGVRYIDGGLSDNQPTVMEGDTITVSPWSGESDICPSDDDSASFLGFQWSNTSIRFTARNLYRTAVALFPPHPEVMSRMCRQGFEDALRYLAKNDLIACTRCIEVRSYITVPEETLEEADLADSAYESDRLTRNSSVGTSLSESNRLKKSVSSPAFRRMYGLDSDCDSCKKTAKHAHGKGLPQIVKRTLDDALAPDKSWLGWAYRWLPMRLIKIMALPWLLPMDMTYTCCMRMLEWLPYMGGDAKWLVDKATKALEFLLSEIETSRHLYSARYTCQLAITELEYNNAKDTPIPMAATTWDEKEMNFGFSVDLNTKSRPVRQMASIVKKTTPAHSDVKAKAVAKATENLEWAGIQAGGERTEQELDQFASIVEFTRRHESLMAFYYLDEQNQVKVTEIFGLNDQDEIGPLRTGLSQTVSRHSSFRNTPPPAPVKQVTFDTGVDDLEDSGWSSHATESKRDACCSPVQQLVPPPTVTPRPKRDTIHKSKRWSAPLNWAVSSDSEEEHDKFFIPDRRQRTVSEDYEAGNSSNED